MMVKGEDGQMVECEIVSTRDHESVFDKNAPVLPVFLSVICALLNIVPGRYYLLYAFDFKTRPKSPALVF